MPQVSDLYVEALEGYFDLLEPALDGVLCRAGNAARIRAVARGIPANAVRYFGFEWPLGAEDGGVDLAVSLSGKGLAWLQSQAVWPQTRQLLARVSAGVRTDSENVWLEWDTRHARPAAEPSLYITIDDPATLPAHDREILFTIAGAGASTLARCLSAIPATARRVHVGFMLQRGDPALRAGILPMSARAAASFLQDAGWHGNAFLAERLLDPFSDVCDGFSVQIDCTENGVSLVGSELIFNGVPTDRQPENEPRWYGVFDRLVDLGYATREQASRLLAWPSQRTFAAPLIERLMACAPEACAGRLLDGTLATGLQHVKLATRDGLDVRAKAYFGAAFFDRE